MSDQVVKVVGFRGLGFWSILTLLFVAAKLFGFIACSWWLVLAVAVAPWVVLFAVLAFVIVLFVLAACVAVWMDGK